MAPARKRNANGQYGSTREGAASCVREHLIEDLVRQRTLETGRKARADGIRSDQSQHEGKGDAIHKYSEAVRAVRENQELVQEWML